MFVVGKDYSREDIHVAVGGNKQAFLPTHHGRVVAACLKPERNPDAPQIVLCSSGAAARAAGRTLAQQKDAIPVFVHVGNERWRYEGDFATEASLSSPPDCLPFISGSGFTIGQISRVIKLRRAA